MEVGPALVGVAWYLEDVRLVNLVMNNDIESIFCYV